MTGYPQVAAPNEHATLTPWLTTTTDTSTRTTRGA